MDNQHLSYESISDVDIKEELVESDDEMPWNIDTECSVEESAIKRQRLNSSNEEEEEESCMDEEELQSPETIFVQMGYETEESNSEEEMDPLAQDDENLIGDVAEEKQTKKENSSYGELHNSFRIGISTLRSIIKDTCKKIWSILQPTVLPVPTVEKWKEIAELFWKRGNFPNCIGAIDGRCFRTVSPNSCTSRRKKTLTSLVLLAVCDTEYCFTLVDIGKKNSDVFEESSISNLISSNSLNLPPPCPLPNTSSPNLPFLMVGDEAFPLSRNVMRPYGGKNLKGEKSVFNYRLTRAQRFIECSFGIFSNKWHIVQRPFNVHEDFATDIIKACIILHNFVITRDGFLFEDTLTQVGLIDFVGNGNQRSRNAAKIRDHLAKYFVGTGSVPWQMS
ncbi:Putative nuclease HARBI1 [Gryllus bimaculatus]|nr:Putative nuclease HARBI1 [Gryllus bimaculatus]